MLQARSMAISTSTSYHEVAVMPAVVSIALQISSVLDVLRTTRHVLYNKTGQLLPREEASRSESGSGRCFCVHLTCQVRWLAFDLNASASGLAHQCQMNVTPGPGANSTSTTL